MVRRKPTAFMLKRGELRQSWNKYNLYNLSRFRSPLSTNMNYFKQKWASKAKTRKYHGEQVLEKHWKRLFSPTMRAVVPMNPRYLARSDGSIESAGRGAGFDQDSNDRDTRGVAPTPYMNMAYAPLERRLDVAVHRALFASSVRQARQFCVHGAVKVNGKTMPYPGYALNPGDMFQVDPDRVMFATGAPKGALDRRDTRRFRKAQNPETTQEEEAENEAAAQPEAEAESDAPLPEEDATKTLQRIMAKTKDILATQKTTASASRKRELRELSKLVRKTISKTPKGASPTAEVSDQMSALMEKLSIQEVAEEEPGAAKTGNMETAESKPERSLTKKQKRDLETILEELRDNPIDPPKPYATPWRPRDFMSAFAFIPRYLEVHHKVCSAVYLRHPVARPGLAEVPTPFSLEMNQLAFNWYLRRR